MPLKSTGAQNGSSRCAVRELVVEQLQVLTGEELDRAAEWEVDEPVVQLAASARRSPRATTSGAWPLPGLLKLTAPTSHGMMISSAYESPGYHENLRTDVAIATAIAFRCGGRVDASAHCVKPM